jgi:hypothetical protein
MLPPSPYTQSILKRAEAMRSATNTPSTPTTTMAPPNVPTQPPPAYTLTPQPPPPQQAPPHPPQQLQAPFPAPLPLPATFSIPASAFLDDPDSDIDYSDDEGDDDGVDAGKQTQAPAPIIIKIDTSLKIEGHGNTILLPSTRAGSLGLRSAATATGRGVSPAAAQMQVPKPQPSSTNTASNTNTPHTTNTTASQPQPQTTTTTYPTHSPSPSAITASILLALRAAGLLDISNHYINPTSTFAATSTSTSIASTNPNSRPIEISIDAGIKVVGSRTLITRGGNGGLKILRKPGAAASATGDKSVTVEGAAPKTGECVEGEGGETSVLGVQNGNGNERKRRAESVSYSLLFCRLGWRGLWLTLK